MKTSLSFAVILLLSACSTNSLRPEQKLNLNNYYAKIYESCVKSKEKNGNTTKGNIGALCKNETSLMLKNTEYGFNHYQKKHMLSSCNKKTGIELNDCLLNFQKKAYDKAISKSIKKRYK